jgi:thiol-disulfide isomerase/thioredoxin
MSRRRLVLAIILLFAASLPAQQLKEVPKDALKVGDTAPPLVFETVLQGPAPADITWQSLSGKVVILDFWGSWCAPCVERIPHLNQLAAHYKDKPVQVIAVGHENARKASWFLGKHPIAGWVALDTDLSVYKSYTAWGIPYVVIVDQKGTVAAILHPNHLDTNVVDAVLTGKTPNYPELGEGAYWDPAGAAKWFLEVGKEEPPPAK